MLWIAILLIAAHAVSTLSRAENANQVRLGTTGSALGLGTAQSTAHSVVDTGQVRAELLVHAPEGVAPGKPLWLGLLLLHQPHWHTYWKNPGDSGLPTQLRWTLPAGLHAGDIAWPLPHKIAVDTLVNLGYEGEVLLAVPVQVDARFAATGTVDIGLEASWLACRNNCIPQEGQMQLRLPTAGSTSLHAGRFAAALAATPSPLRGSVSARAEADGLHLRVLGLPADWRGLPVLALPESTELLDTPALPDTRDRLYPAPLAPGQQGWVGEAWEARIPYSPQRSSAPARLDWVFHGGPQRTPPPGSDAKTSSPAFASTHSTGINIGTGSSTAADTATTGSLRGSASVEGNWPALAAAASVSPALQQALDAQARAAASSPDAALWWPMLLSALLGGLILNLMPCVLPVLALKVLALASPASHTPASSGLTTHPVLARRLQGLAYTAGVVLSLVALGGLLLLLRAGGAQLGWGFQLQSSGVVVGLALLFTLLALNLADWLPVGMLLPQRLAGVQMQHPLAEAFVSGALVVAVASPCTAPFMGAALGYALTLPGAQALLLFATLGLGLALPYALAAWLPPLGRWLPRPGAWMQTLRQFLAFPMAATVVWLVWVLGHLAGVDAAAGLLLLLLSGCMLVWALHQQGRARRLLAIISIAACALSISLSGIFDTQTPALQLDADTNTQPAPGVWHTWSVQAQEAALQSGQPVLIDFTAAWCITCQVNKKTTLERADVLAALAARQVRLLRADWTRRDPAITQALQTLGRSGVPVYALYTPGQARPLLLDEILTPSALMAALDALP